MKKLLILTFLYSSFLNYSQILDDTFDIDGIVTNQFSTSRSTDIVGAAILQPDGKIIYVGKGLNEFYSFVYRQNVDGSYDTSFNSYGYLTIKGTGFDSIALQNDGKILVGGKYEIYRFNTDGTKDISFGINGVVTIIGNNTVFYSKSIILQDNGKIILSGTNYAPFAFNTMNSFQVVRLNNDGSLDTSFDFDGKKIIEISIYNDEGFAAALQLDGKILITGRSKNFNNKYNIATARLNNDGSLDNTFGINGIVFFQNSSASVDLAKSITVQPDNKILICGSSSSNLLVLRYNINGTLDTTFDLDGIFLSSYTTPISSTTINDYGQLLSFGAIYPVIKILNNGKILVAATLNADHGMIKLNSNGSLDTTFGVNGVVLSNTNTSDLTSFLVIKPDESYSTGGTSSDGTNTTLERKDFNQNGINTFNKTFSLSEGTDKIISSIEQNDGKIISLCEFHKETLIKHIIRRHNINGTLDLNFGINGEIDLNTFILKLLILSDGKIIVLNNGTPILYKFNNNGTPDLTFGINGVKDYTLDNSNILTFIDTAFVTSNDEIYLGFDYHENGGNSQLSSFGLIKINSNGNINSTFGTNGFATTRFDFFGASSNEWPSNIFVQSDNKIILAGRLSFQFGTTMANSAIGITRFNIDGTLDTSFGNEGKVISQINNKNYINQLIGLSNDKFIINAFNETNSVIKTHTLKYNSNGSLDLSFGNDGLIQDNFKSNSMVVLNDSKILKSNDLNNKFSIFGYLSNGLIDTDFGVNGTLNTDINYFSTINSLLLTQDNKLLAGGYSFNGLNYVMTQARYTNLTLGILTLNSTKNSLLVYPDPIENVATFDYNLENETSISIAIIDLQGKVVKNIVTNKTQTEGNYKLNIDLSNGFSSGNYFIRIATPTGNQSIQIIKK